MTKFKLKTDLGFTKGRTPNQKARIEKQLEKLIRYDGTIGKMSEYIVYSLLQGCYPEVEEKYWDYKRNGERSKPKDLYKLQNIDGSAYFELNKTQFDFCCYCYENFKTLDAVKTKDEEEFTIFEKARLKQEEEARLRLEQEEKEKKEEEDFKILLRKEQENISQWQRDIEGKLLKEEYGEDFEWNYFVSVCVNNFDNHVCKKKLISHLKSYNSIGWKIFKALTGVKLPTKYRDRIEFLKNITSKDFVNKDGRLTDNKKENTKKINLNKFYKKLNSDILNCLYNKKNYTYTETEDMIYFAGEIKKDFGGTVLFCIPKEKFFVDLKKNGGGMLNKYVENNNDFDGIIHKEKCTLQDGITYRCIHNKTKDRSIFIRETDYSYFSSLENVSFKVNDNKKLGVKIFSNGIGIGCILQPKIEEIEENEIYNFFGVKK